MTCVFCQILAGELPMSEVYNDDDVIALMDIHPFRPGHVLILPRRHQQYVRELPEGGAEGLMAVGTRIAEAIRASDLPSDGMHFLLNDGPAANQSVPHVHLHLIPRRRGDGGYLLAQLAKRPLLPLLGSAPRARLDDHARQIREHLRAHGDR